MEHVQEILRQVIQGEDFESPATMLKSVKAEAATRILPGFPYSLATNVAHADIWNRLWLARLEGTPKFNPFPDFPPQSEKDWPKVRDQFLANFERAYAIACAEPFVHKCRTDAIAEKTLLKIAVHTSYHLGQIKLLKRALRATSRKSTGD